MSKVNYLPLTLLFLCVIVHIGLSQRMAKIPRKPLIESLNVVLPAYLQVLFAGGDRYLAANINITRAMAFRGIDAKAKDFAIQAKIQQQVAILNPKQEDNGYLAAAILSWQGQTTIANQLLQTIGDARPWDSIPYFFKAFNLFYFDREFIAAGQLLEQAAQRAEGKNKSSLRAMAAKWYTQDDNPTYALNILRALHQEENEPKMRATFTARIQQIEGLIILRNAVQQYYQEHGKVLYSLQQLVELGILPQLPVDPIGLGYHLTTAGKVEIKTLVKRKFNASN